MSEDSKLGKQRQGADGGAGGLWVNPDCPVAGCCREVTHFQTVSEFKLQVSEARAGGRFVCPHLSVASNLLGFMSESLYSSIFVPSASGIFSV